MKTGLTDHALDVLQNAHELAGSPDSQNVNAGYVLLAILRDRRGNVGKGALLECGMDVRKLKTAKIVALCKSIDVAALTVRAVNEALAR